MRQVPFIMPQLGESIAEATILRFLVQAGTQVNATGPKLEYGGGRRARVA